MFQITISIRSVLVALVSGLLLSAHGQANSLVIPANINLPKDVNIKNQLIDSLNGFLAQKEKKAVENPFVAVEGRLETALLLDELKGMDKSNRTENAAFYRPYLLNCAPLEGTNFLVQFSYIGLRDDTCLTRASFRLQATHKDSQFYFSSPLRENTAGWKQENVGRCVFHFRQTLDHPKAEAYDKLISSFDDRLKAAGQVTEVFCCDDLPEALQLAGVDYKSDYNGYGSTTFDTHDGRQTLVVNGDAGGTFGKFSMADAHDLWHARLHNVLSVTIINRPVDEGCAYLYGGSWGYSWAEILRRFHEKLASNPQADWLDLYQSLYNFGDSQDKHLMAAYVINALIVQKIEKEQGFAAVMELLSCGKYEKGNKNYFKALEKITGINQSNFNDEVWKLVRAN